jgi:hypothetical protein
MYESLCNRKRRRDVEMDAFKVQRTFFVSNFAPKIEHIPNMFSPPIKSPHQMPSKNAIQICILGGGAGWGGQLLGLYDVLR